MRFRWLALAGIIFAADPAVAKEDKQIAALLAMTPADFAQRVSVKDDALETAATLTTQSGFQYKSGILRQVLADAFFRAFVNKTTGETTYQIYYSVTYDASGWLFIQRANYIGADGLVSVATDKIGSDVSCGRYGCTYLETVGADISERNMRWLAGQYSAGVDNGMKVRFKTQGGQDLDITIMPAEAAGLMQRVDEYSKQRAQH